MTFSFSYWYSDLSVSLHLRNGERKAPSERGLPSETGGGACGTEAENPPYQGAKGEVARAPSVAYGASSLPEGALITYLQTVR